MKPKHKALEKFTANGIRILSKAEQREKMKSWPKAGSSKNITAKSSDAEKNAYQHKFKRAWND